MSLTYLTRNRNRRSSRSRISCRLVFPCTSINAILLLWNKKARFKSVDANLIIESAERKWNTICKKRMWKQTIVASFKSLKFLVLILFLLRYFFARVYNHKINFLLSPHWMCVVNQLVNKLSLDSLTFLSSFFFSNISLALTSRRLVFMLHIIALKFSFKRIFSSSFCQSGENFLWKNTKVAYVHWPNFLGFFREKYFFFSFFSALIDLLDN